MTNETKSETERPVRDGVGWDDLAEDVFGLSVRGLVTIRDLVVRPAKVFAAARQTAWSGLYTPSLRLVAFLITVMLLLRVFWAAEEAVMYQNVLSMLETAAAENPDIGDPVELASLYFAAWALSFPIVYFPLHLLASVLLRVWGKGTRSAVRVRLYFAALVPAMCVSVTSLAIIPSLTLEQALLFSTAGFLVAVLIYALTVHFGLRETGMPPRARLWRGGLFALFASLTDTMIAIGAGIAASFLMAAIRDGYSVPGLG